jgi:hypothetical protein
METEHIAELIKLISAHIGEAEQLYSLVYNGYSVFDIKQVEDDEEPIRRILCPPVTYDVVLEAEQRLGFSLPPLLRAVYTQIGNGGLCLNLLGLEGGQTGGDDIFPGLSVVEIYHVLESWRQDGKISYLPPQLLPVNDDLGCGMVDYVDCRTPIGQIWRSDSGSLSMRQPTLLNYFHEAIKGYRALIQNTSN